MSIIDINNLSLINVSQDYINSGRMDAYSIENIGSFVQSVNDWAFSIYLVVFCLGALLFYFVLYKSKLIPRFISAWGFLAAALLLTGSVLILLEVFTGISQLGLELIFVLPIAVNEMVLAIWLIVKGFNLSAITASK